MTNALSFEEGAEISPSFPPVIEAFQHALKLAPNSTKTLNNLGNVYLSLQKTDLAEKEFTHEF